MGEENQLSSAVSDAIITESDKEPSPGQKTAGLLTLWEGDPIKKLAEQTSSFAPTESGSGYVYTETGSTVQKIEVVPGRVEWSFSTGGTIDHMTLGGNKLIIAAEDGVYVVNVLTGEELWFQSTQYKVDYVTYDPSDDVVYGAISATLTAWDGADGTQINTNTRSENMTTVLYSDGALYVSDYGYVARVDPETLTNVWRTGLSGTGGAGRHIAEYQSNVFVTADDVVYAADKQSGDIEWSINARAIRDYYLIEGVLHFHDLNSDEYYAVDPDTGDVIWTTPATNVVGGVVKLGGLIYFHDNGGVKGVDPDDGTLKVEYDTFSAGNGGGAVEVVDGVLVTVLNQGPVCAMAPEGVYAYRRQQFSTGGEWVDEL